MPIRDLAKFVNKQRDFPIVVAEVGVEKGLNATEMLGKMNISRLYLIDPYPEYTDCSTGYVSKQVNQDTYRMMFNNVQNWLDKITLVHQTSQFAATLFPDEFFDFVYIDGNHDYEPVRTDIAAWWPKVKVGGIIGGHDYKGIPHVERAAKEFCLEKNLVILEFLDDERNTEWGIVK